MLPEYYLSSSMNLVKLESYKVNTQKSVVNPYTNNERSKREIQETVLFIITPKRLKYLRINLPEEIKDLY